MFEQHWIESVLNGLWLRNQFVISIIKAQGVMPQDQRNGCSFLVEGLGESALPASLTVTPLSLPSPSLCHILTKVICPHPHNRRISAFFFFFFVAINTSGESILTTAWKSNLSSCWDRLVRNRCIVACFAWRAGAAKVLIRNAGHCQTTQELGYEAGGLPQDPRATEGYQRPVKGC